MEEADWKSRMFESLYHALDTHQLQIKLLQKDLGIQGRRRHRGAMPLLIFTTIALGMILIPMGFQFLAVLGGKALLLAKLALILSAIQGLKKIATSDVNYGLYHLPSTGNPWKDRRWLLDMALAQQGDKPNHFLQHEDIAASTNIEHAFPPHLDPRV